MPLILMFLKSYWKQAAIALVALALLSTIGIQHLELKHDATKLDDAAKLHLEDQATIAGLGDEIKAQNAAVQALQDAQALKQQQAAKALADAQAKQQKLGQLLAQTNGKTAATCDAAMPDIRNILKGIQQQ